MKKPGYYRNKLARLAYKIGRSVILFLEAGLIMQICPAFGFILFAFLAAPITNILAGYVIPYVFYWCTLQFAKARALKNDFIYKLKNIKQFLKNHIRSTLIRLIIGAALGVFLYLFNTHIVNIAALVDSLYPITFIRQLLNIDAQWEEYKEWFYNTMFRSSVVVAPLTEEIIFRGIILNGIKFVCTVLAGIAAIVFGLFSVKEKPAPQKTLDSPVRNREASGSLIDEAKKDAVNAITYLKKAVFGAEDTQPTLVKSIDVENQTAQSVNPEMHEPQNTMPFKSVVSEEPVVANHAMAKTPADNENEPIVASNSEIQAPDKIDNSISAFSVVSSAMIFSLVHSASQRPFALIGGLALGQMYEYYDEEDDDHTANVAAHMSNNYMCLRELYSYLNKM